MRWLFASILSLTACGMRKPPDPSRKLAVHVEGDLFDSDRGYRFAALPEPSASIVRLDVRYPVGSADDPPGKAGLAHLVEHLMFDLQMNTADGKTSVSDELGRIALSWNAVTMPDYTDYQVVAAPDSINELVAIEVNRALIGCTGLSREVFDRERDVVVAELRERQGATGAQLNRTLIEALYPEGHPYRQTDSVDTVAALTYEDACGFMATRYRSGTVSIVASGAVTRDSLQQAAAAYLGQAPKRAAATRQPPTRLTPMKGTVHLHADTTDTMVVATWPLPARNTRDFRLLELVTVVLDTYLGGYAQQYGWGHDANLAVIGGDYAPVLALSVALNSPDDADEAIAATEKAVYLALKDLGGTNGEQDSPEWIARWQLTAETELARWESLAGRNDMVAESLTDGQDGVTVVQRIDEISHATAREAHDLASAWLDMDRRRVLVIEPTADAVLEGASTKQRRYVEASDVHVDGKLADTPLTVPPHAPRPAPERFVTENGVHVVLWPHGELPLVHGRHVVAAGTAHDPIGIEGLALLTGPDELASDSMTFDNRTMSSHVDDLTRGLAAMGGRYEVTDETLKAVRKSLSRPALVEETDYEQKVLVALYGADHPYARVPITAASTKRITHDNAQSWERDHITAANSTMILAGQFDPALVRKYAAYDTDQRPSGKATPPITKAPVTTASFVRGVLTKPTPNVGLQVAFVAGAGMDSDHGSRLVLERILESRLSQLRSSEAVTYGVHVSYEPRRAGGEWSIEAAVDATRAAEAMTTLLAALDELRTNPESYREAFVLARQQVLESMLLSSGSAASVANQLANLARFGLEDTALDSLETQVAGMTLTPFAAFVKRELPREKQVVGALGNDEYVEEALDAAHRAAAAP